MKQLSYKEMECQGEDLSTKDCQRDIKGYSKQPCSDYTSICWLERMTTNSQYKNKYDFLRRTLEIHWL